MAAWHIVNRSLHERHGRISYDCGTEEFAELVMSELRRITARFPGAYQLTGNTITDN
jgi:hypothetical protein